MNSSPVVLPTVMEMKNILLGINSRLDDLTKVFHQLKSENEILRKDIFGVSSSQNPEGMGLMGTKTLREIAEDIEFYVKRINTNIISMASETETPRKLKSRDELKTTLAKESDSESLEKSADEFPIIEIRSKTSADEREILKETFNKLIAGIKVKDGESFHGTSVQTISNRISLPQNEVSSCTIKLLAQELVDLQEFFGNSSEVFSFIGDTFSCNLLCSFAISEVLQLTIYCANTSDGKIWFGIAFTPKDVPTDPTLWSTLHHMPPAPDVYMMNKEWSEIPLELFVTHGNLLVRGHMTNGPRSIVHIEILELRHTSWPIPVVGGKKRFTGGKSFESIQSTDKDGSPLNSVGNRGRLSCNVTIVNCLNVPLLLMNKWCCNSTNKDFWPLEIPSFHGETFLESSDT